MEKLKVRAYAKINWTLRVLGLRGDGFHDIETVFQSISLHDTLEFHEASATRMVCRERRIPVDRRNLVVAAVERLRAIADFGHVRIKLDKRIPVGGGLGGGSSDAAATLVALTRLFDLDVSRRQLLEIAAELGSDVPFFLHGGIAWASGRGERIEALPDSSPVPLLLVYPHRSMSTREAYAALGRTENSPSKVLGLEAWRTMVEEGILANRSSLENDFETPFFAKYPDLRRWKEELLCHGAAVAQLSGSGSTIFGAFGEAAARDEAADALRDRVRVATAETLTAMDALSY